MATIDWSAETDRTVEMLRSLIRFDTTNPPGNERECAVWLAQQMSEHMDEIRLTCPSEDGQRVNMLGRLRGTGAKQPLLLHGHLDVVPVERDKWSVDPFAGVLKDGFVWGRGAVDMKNMVAMCATVIRLIAQQDLTLKRDIIFAAVADEEAGGVHGAARLVAEVPELVRAEYAIGEMGGFSVDVGGKRFYLIQTAEKGACWFRLSAKGAPGHGSIPDQNSATVQLARAVAALGSRRLPHRMCGASDALIRGMASGIGGVQGTVFGGLRKSWAEPFVQGLLARQDPVNAQSLAAIVHNTVSPNALGGGGKINVIPSHAHADCDGRMVPGCSSKQFLAEVRRLIGDGLDIEVLYQRDGAEAPIDDQIMDVFRESLLAHDPGGIVVPNLITGSTDAAHWSKLGTKCYGFSPLRMPAELKFKDLVHGHDERVPVEGIAFGLRALYDAVVKLVT